MFKFTKSNIQKLKEILQKTGKIEVSTSGGTTTLKFDQQVTFFFVYIFFFYFLFFIFYFYF